MRGHCLQKEELDRLIKVELEGKTLHQDDEKQVAFQYLLDSWKSWDIEFICLATILSQILERKIRQGVNAQSTLEQVYSLSERTGLGLVIEECGDDFVTYMLRFARRDNLSMEENLVEIRNQLSEYVYPPPE